MKKLFILLKDCGDGSSYPQYTMNEEWINDRKKLDLCWPDIGCDGDGFHCEILTVPDECTLESMGIHSDCADRPNGRNSCDEVPEKDEEEFE